MTASSDLRFGTKAETLERLAPLLRCARVLAQVRCSAGSWRGDPQHVLDELRQRGWLEAALIVRSSAVAEDSAQGSLAGRYESIGQRVGAEAVGQAIEDVFQGLAADGVEDADQVFIQPQLEDVRMSGVALTRDPNNGSHYTIVSYDDRSGRTDTITSGAALARRTYYQHEGAPRPGEPDLAAVLALARELEGMFPGHALDIEFAITQDGALYLFQVRPLLLPKHEALGRAQEARAVARVRDRLRELSGPHPYLYGTRAVFGTMPDWNPAEVIGARPKPLALSLYKELVTDSIWAYQRSNYGYRNLRSFPLLLSLGGLPYVDVRVSFNSFVPADLDARLGRRLVDHYIERLLASPLDHDKVEFAIVYSCYTLDLAERLGELERAGFRDAECRALGRSLRSLTNRITAGSAALFRLDLAKIRELERRQSALWDGAQLDPVSRIYWLLEDCKRYGTLPFAGIARAAFIAVQLLDSAVATEILSVQDREAFMRSLHTVRGRMNEDLGRIPRAEFLRQYGHLRPGTYDVTSARYDETPDAYFDWSAARTERDAAPRFEPTSAQARELDRMLESHGLEHDQRSFFAFLRAAIEGREYAKFVFSRSLSEALRGLVDLAAQCGLSRADLAYSDIEIIRRLYGSSEDVGALLATSIEAGKARFAVTRQLTLPALVTKPADALAFHVPVCEPNYVTMQSAEGRVVAPSKRASDLNGGIVMIQSADPGHDWIFSHAVAGFITMYGGYNSHMAIRANELGIPAVIGAGESLYRTWRPRSSCVWTASTGASRCSGETHSRHPARRAEFSGR